VLFSIAKALRENGDRVVYFAGYKRGEDLFKQDEIEAATDQVIWCTDAGVEITPRRAQDRHFRGNIVEAMVAYAKPRARGRALRAARRAPHHRHRQRSHDERRARGAARRAGAASSIRSTSASAASTRRCSA
jgi:hypothetical protein